MKILNQGIDISSSWKLALEIDKKLSETLTVENLV